MRARCQCPRPCSGLCLLWDTGHLTLCLLYLSPALPPLLLSIIGQHVATPSSYLTRLLVGGGNSMQFSLRF